MPNFVISSPSYTQETAKEKLSKIEGDVSKITITAGSEDYTFEGDEAAKLFRKMRSGFKKVNTFVIKSDGKKGEGTKKIIIKSGSGDHEVYKFSTCGDYNAIWFSDDCVFYGLNKNIKVEIEDGKKKVTVTTTENGDKKTEVYEGDEADEFLEKMKSEHGHDILIEIDENGNHKKVKK